MSLATEHVLGKRNYGKVTQTAGTAIVRMVEPWQNGWTRLTMVRYTCGTTAHTLTLMRPFNVVTFTALGASGQAVVNISADPGHYSLAGTIATADNLIAGGDYVVYEVADGSYVVDTVASVSTLAITMTTNLPTSGVAIGGRFWWFGLAADTNPNNNQANPIYNAVASSVLTLGRSDGLCSIPDNRLLNVGKGKYQPLILYDANATAAGTIESVGVEYIRKAAA
jgi:hypothetical protein